MLVRPHDSHVPIRREETYETIHTGPRDLYAHAARLAGYGGIKQNLNKLSPELR